MAPLLIRFVLTVADAILWCFGLYYLINVLYGVSDWPYLQMGIILIGLSKLVSIVRQVLVEGRSTVREVKDSWAATLRALQHARQPHR